MSVSRTTSETAPIAIVGIGCRFPGAITDVASFWRVLSEGLDAITEIPLDRIDIGQHFDPRAATPGRMMTRWGGFLERIDEFDAEFFGVSPREAERLDPQQRLLLETAWEALEDAGQDLRKLEGSSTGVFIGQWTNDFEARAFADIQALDFFAAQGSGRYASSGRISYALGLRGPSLTLDTACSSSLVALHVAIQSIRSGESQMALVGGANIILQPQISIAYSQARMMAVDGRCKFGDVSGDGYVRSEGVGLVVLKLLDRALADGDRVYAVIRGSAVNNDGRSSGSMGTPSRIGQEQLLRSAYRDAGLSSGRVGYIEAHGTGTRAGDPIELGALAAVLSEGREPGHDIYVGSVKTNIGHTEAAAGMAGLIKAALALHHELIPPSLHCQAPNPAVPWADLPLTIARAGAPWPRGDRPRIAGVSAFGISGTNAHVVLEEASSSPTQPNAVQRRSQSLLPLSAKSPDALRALAVRFADLLEPEFGPSLHDICWSAARRRTALERRAVFVAADRAAMVQSLRRYADGEAAAAQGVARANATPKICFVCPGQGAQFVGMARQLMAEEPIFFAELQRCDQAARPLTDWSILEQLSAEPGAKAYRLDEINVIQPVLVALSIAYASLLRSLGLEPAAVVGHSMGEVAAACVAGALDLDQAMRVICRRSALMRRTCGQGAMALVDLSMEAATARLVGLEDRLSVAVSNSPRSSVISGDPEALQQVMAELEQDDVFCRLVKVDVASHSPQMDPLVHELSADLAGLAPGEAHIPIWSTALGRRAEGHEFDAAYWGGNLRRTVRFTDVVGQLLADGISVFVELGPHPILLHSVQQTAQSLSYEATTVACGRRGEGEQAAVLTALGQLWAAGSPVEWDRVAPEPGRNVPLPLYPWQRERHWLEAAEIGVGSPGAQVESVRPDDESRQWLYRLRWELCDLLRASTTARVRDTRWLIVSADGEAESGSALAAAFLSAGADASMTPLERLETAIAEHARSAGSSTGVIVIAADGPDAAYLPVNVLQVVLKAKWKANPRLWLATHGGQSVATVGMARASADQAAVWGAGRVIAEEHPDLWGGLVDLDSANSLSTNAALFVRHVLSADGEDQAAFRSNQRYVLRLVPVDERERRSAAFACRPDASYLITGGLGDVGLHIARAMVARGARRLVLLNRTPLPPREQWSKVEPETVIGQRIAAIRELEAAGVAVHVAAVDVGDETQLRAFLARFAAEAWPPIRGVVHAAGSLDNHLAGDLSRAAFDAVLGPKLRAAQLLDRLLPDLDLFVLFSSTGAFLAQPGQANYAAANAGLDALAHDRKARGLPALSIGWGVWENTGLVKGEAGQRNVAELARQGVGAFSPERATSLFAWLCGGADPSVAVLPIDWASFRHARGNRDFPIFRRMLRDAAGQTPGLTGLLKEAGPAERRQLLDEAVRAAVGVVLKISPSRLDPRKALGEMGLNSLMAMELRNRLEAAVGRPLSATLAWNYPTVEALVAHLAGTEPAAESTPAPIKFQQPPADLFARIHEVADLSDEQALAALRA